MVLEHLMERGVLTEDQWGFSQGKYTVTALLSSFHSILKMLESGADVSLVFFDLHKAFDNVPHLSLLQKLHEFGVNQHILHCVTCYLSDRKQYVVMNGVSSENIPVISAVRTKFNLLLYDECSLYIMYG